MGQAPASSQSAMSHSVKLRTLNENRKGRDQNDEKLKHSNRRCTSGSGKVRRRKNVAKALGIEYIDTGAMYRAAAYKALSCGVPVSDDEAVGEMLSGTEIDFVQGNIILDGENVNDKIRTLEISKAASQVSKLVSCRNKLVEIQRRIAAAKSVVMDGRDIGTNVLPGASHKFYVTASLETRRGAVSGSFRVKARYHL